MPEGSGGEWQFPIPVQSLPIDFNNGTITQARMTATIVSGDYYEFFMSADGGTSWEQVSNGITHTFVSSGTSLCWRIIGYGAGVISKVVIDNYH